MSTSLTPSLQTMASVKLQIQTTLKTELAGVMLAQIVAPLLSTVNLWSTQIPVMLEGTGSSASANLIFSIRKDLFVSPSYTQNVLNVPSGELPTPFQEFTTFIQQLIDAQKVEKEKTGPKASTSHSKSNTF